RSSAYRAHRGLTQILQYLDNQGDEHRQVAGIEHSVPGGEESLQLRDVAVRPTIYKEAAEPPDRDNDHDPIKTQAANRSRLLLNSRKRNPQRYQFCSPK